MKILATIDVVAGADLAALRQKLADEVKGSWSLFTAGFLREAYATTTPTRVVFVLEAESRSEADEKLRALPLIAAGLVRVELTELRPFVNWSLLFAP